MYIRVVAKASMTHSSTFPIPISRIYLISSIRAFFFHYCENATPSSSAFQRLPHLTKETATDWVIPRRIYQGRDYYWQERTRLAPVPCGGHYSRYRSLLPWTSIWPHQGEWRHARHAFFSHFILRAQRRDRKVACHWGAPTMGHDTAGDGSVPTSLE